MLFKKKGAVAFLQRQPYGRITRATKRVFQRGLNFTGDEKEWQAGRKEKEAQFRRDREYGIVHKLHSGPAMKGESSLVEPPPELTVYLLDTEQDQASTKTSEIAEDGWGFETSTTSAQASDIPWGGSDALDKPNEDPVTALFNNGLIVRADTVPHNSVQTLDEDWGGFGTTITAVRTPPQSQSAAPEWGGPWSTSIRPDTDKAATLADFTRGGSPVNVASTGKSLSNSTPRLNHETGITWSAERNEWGGHISPPATNTSKLEANWGGAHTTTAIATANNTNLTWDDPLPSTEKTPPITTLDIFSTVVTNRNASGNQNQTQLQERQPSSEEALADGSAPRNPSCSVRRNERSSAPSPDLFQENFISSSFGTPAVANWGRFDDILGNNVNILVGDGSTKIDTADWGGTYTSRPAGINNDIEASHQWSTLEQISEVSDLAPDSNGDSRAPSVEQSNYLESSSQASTYAQSSVDTPASTPITQSRHNSICADQSINPERLAMLAALQETMLEHEDTEKENAEPENHRYRGRSKKSDNSNYMDLPFNRLDQIHGKGDAV